MYKKDGEQGQGGQANQQAKKDDDVIDAEVESKTLPYANTYLYFYSFYSSITLIYIF